MKVFIGGEWVEYEDRFSKKDDKSKKSSSSFYDDEDYYDYYDYSRSSKKKKYKSSVGWTGGSLSSSTSYYTTERSSYFKSWEDRSGDLTEKDKENQVILQKAYPAVRDLIVILDFPFRVYIQVGKKDENVTDETGKKRYGDRRICLNTKVLDNDGYSDIQKINTLCGIGIHEASHLMFTEYRVYDKFLTNKGTEFGSDVRGYLRSLVNLIEDERIEDKLLRERPGFSDFIEQSKEWSSSRLKTSLHHSEAAKVVVNLYHLIRFPENIDKDIIEKHAGLYKKISNLLNPLPLNTKETCQVAFEMFKLVKSYLTEELNLDDKAFQNNIRLGSEYIDKSYKGISYGSDNDSGVMMDESEMGHVLTKDAMISKLLVGAAEKGEKDYSYFEKVVGDAKSYKACVSRVKKYIPGIRKLISGTDKNYDFNILGCRSGILDTTKLAEAYQGVPQVYMRQVHVRTNKTTVCVLVDESGSMWGDKEDLARDAAILLNESFGTLPGIDLYIYGHTADVDWEHNSVNLSVYREGNKYRPRYALSSIKAREQNRDGDAIYETAVRVRKHTDSQCIMFVISDGEPCAHGYGGYDAIEDVRKKVEKVEAMGFNVIQITIDNVYTSDKMFTKHVELKDDLSELPKRLSEVIKKVVLDDKKTVIT